MTKDNVKSTVVADGFVTASELCTGALRVGLQGSRDLGVRWSNGDSTPRAGGRKQAIRPGPGSGPGRLRRQRRRGGRPRRRQRRRQVDAGEDDRRDPLGGLRQHPLRRERSLDLPAPGRDRTRDRDRLPGPRSLRQPRRRRQRLPRAARRSPRASGMVSRQLDEARMEHQTAELLSSLAVTIPSLRSEVGTLSGGQRQQVAVARSLLGEPKVVLLDEPTAALGVAQTAQVLKLIKKLRERDLGVVVISHNLADVFEVADRIFVLRLGTRRRDLPGRSDDRGACRRGDHRPRRQRGGRAQGSRRRGASADRARTVETSERRPSRPISKAPPPKPAETLRRLIQGDLASLRVVIGLALIWAIFQFENSRFLSAENLTNLGAPDHGHRVDLGRDRLRPPARRDRPLGRRGQRPRGGLHGGAQRQARLEPLPGDRGRGRGRHARSAFSRARSSPASASPPSSSPWPAYWPGRERSYRCSGRPARSTSPTPRSPASPTPSTRTRSAGSSSSSVSSPTAPSSSSGIARRIAAGLAGQSPRGAGGALRRRRRGRDRRRRSSSTPTAACRSRC